jgi:hypothetical protein
VRPIDVTENMAEVLVIWDDTHGVLTGSNTAHKARAVGSLVFPLGIEGSPLFWERIAEAARSSSSQVWTLLTRKARR